MCCLKCVLISHNWLKCYFHGCEAWGLRPDASQAWYATWDHEYLHVEIINSRQHSWYQSAHLTENCDVDLFTNVSCLAEIVPLVGVHRTVPILCLNHTWDYTAGICRPLSWSAFVVKNRCHWLEIHAELSSGTNPWVIISVRIVWYAAPSRGWNKFANSMLSSIADWQSKRRSLPNTLCMLMQNAKL